jgi:uncharacterized protein
MSKRFTLLLCLLANLLAGWVHADSPLQTIPDYHAHVTDTAHVLSAADRVAIEKQLTDFETQHGSQLGVLIVPSTGQEDITDYTQRVADHWKLGRQGVGDGLLVVVAVNDRRVRIAPYRALEPAVPDVLAKRIIDTKMVPAFRQGDYAGGLRESLQSLQTAILAVEKLMPTPPENVYQKWMSKVKKLLKNEGISIILLIFTLLALSGIRQVLSRFLPRFLAASLTACLGAVVCWLLSANLWLSLFFALMGFFSKLRFIKNGGFGDRAHHKQSSPEVRGAVSGPATTTGGGGDSAGGGASGRW